MGYAAVCWHRARAVPSLASLCAHSPTHRCSHSTPSRLPAAPCLQLPVYIWAPEEEGQFQPGRCSRWWLAASLATLDADLRSRGSRLLAFRSADSKALLRQLAAAHGAGAVLFNHLYDPISMVRVQGGLGGTWRGRIPPGRASVAHRAAGRRQKQRHAAGSAQGSSR